MKITTANANGYTDITLINSAGMEITLCSLGASIRDVKVPDREGVVRSVVLRPESEKMFRKKYYGKTVGRTAGRIAGAGFTVDGAAASLEVNSRGADNIHGGSAGLHCRTFDYSSETNDEYADITFEYFSPDGEGGYFGNVNIKAVYRVYENENTFVLTYCGTTDRKTLLNITNHVYLNMAGDLRDNVLDETLYINASMVGELNERLIPTHAVPVNKAFDFTVPRKIGEYIEDLSVQKNTGGYDHPYFLDGTGLDKTACRLYSEYSGICLSIATTYPCVVFYSDSTPKPGMLLAGGKTDEKYMAACFECQYHPDGIHACPDNCGVFSPEKPYFEQIKYSFTLK